MRYMLEAWLAGFVVYFRPAAKMPKRILKSFGCLDRFVANWWWFLRGRLFRTAGEGTEVGDDCDGVFVFQMVEVHRGTNRFAVCADSFFKDVEPIFI